jgi:hypothetical protein
MELSEFNKVAHVGTVFYKTYLPSTPQNSIPMVIPVFVGGALIPLPTSAGFGGRSRAFYLYYIRPTGGGELLRVAYPEQIPDSTCVEVVIHKDQIAKDGYQIGEAVLKPSTLCK